MSIRTWSSRRMIAIWAGGLMLQAVLILVPAALTWRYVERNGARILREGRETNERWRVGELADSLSLAQQRAAARASDSFSITAQGETLFALVHIPSGRPDSAQVTAYMAQNARRARYFTIVSLWALPAALLLLTASWLLVRRRRGGPADWEAKI